MITRAWPAAVVDRGDLKLQIRFAVFAPVKVTVLKLPALQAVFFWKIPAYIAISRARSQSPAVGRRQHYLASHLKYDGRILKAMTHCFARGATLARISFRAGFRWSDPTPTESRDCLPRQLAGLKMTGSVQP